MKRQRGRLVFQRVGRPEIGAAGRANVAASPISPRFRVLISGAVSKVIHNSHRAGGFCAGIKANALVWRPCPCPARLGATPGLLWSLSYPQKARECFYLPNDGFLECSGDEKKSVFLAFK